MDAGSGRPFTAAACLGAGALALMLSSCRDEPERVAAPPSSGSVSGLPGEVYLTPGPAFPTIPVQNPYADDPQAIADGRRLYGWYNCGGCHGELGGGGMGPPLRDEDWIYGEDPISIFASIMEGRPEGMPTWQGKIPEDQAWRIVAFVQSLGETDLQPTLTPPEDRIPSEGAAAGRPPGGQ